MSKQTFPSLAGVGNQLALLAVIGVLSYAFFDQLYFGELPCPLCLMQRMGFAIIFLGALICSENERCLIGSNDLHRFWVLSDVGHAVNIQSTH